MEYEKDRSFAWLLSVKHYEIVYCFLEGASLVKNKEHIKAFKGSLALKPGIQIINDSFSLLVCLSLRITLKEASPCYLSKIDLSSCKQ